MKASLFSYVISAALSFATIATASKPVENDTISSKKAEISERNVMLNASDANKPREIQIGLPSEDVNVYENGLPVNNKVYPRISLFSFIEGMIEYGTGKEPETTLPPRRYCF